MKDGLDFLGGRNIVLASASPRRRELLGELGACVRLAPVKTVDESFPDSLAPEEVPGYISRIKALAYVGETAPDDILVTADTVVISDGTVLGKPHDGKAAAQMLRRLSGHTHMVVTGVTVMLGDETITFSEKTEVDFARLTDEEIEYYVERYRPMDKAGAYGIQEWIGYIGITGIRGDYYNVMGLPVCALYNCLKRLCGC